MSSVNYIYFELKPGQGGCDSKNWTYMLMCQYIAFFKLRSVSYKVVKCKLSGKFLCYVLFQVFAAGLFKVLSLESGVHKLIRVSPFSRTGRVHTSTCIVRVFMATPCQSVTLNRREVRVETFKARGPGGQSVNKTNSAVRIIHIPTGISVECQRERSQADNKKIAFALLNAKLAFRIQQQSAIARDIVINPRLNRVYNLVKSWVYNYITKRKSSKVAAVLAGNLDLII